MARVFSRGLSRRRAIGMIAAALGVTLGPAFGTSDEMATGRATPQSHSVHCLSTGVARPQVSLVLAEMRKAPGCLCVKVLSDADGQIVMWQEWQSRAAQLHFWKSDRFGASVRHVQRIAI